MLLVEIGDRAGLVQHVVAQLDVRATGRCDDQAGDNQGAASHALTRARKAASVAEAPADEFSAAHFNRWAHPGKK